jgi:hypothetical protein
MYRSSVDGLTEQVHSLEEQKRHLEAELATARRIVRPRRAWAMALASLGLFAVGFVFGSVRAREPLEALRQTCAAEQQAASQRAQMCNDRLESCLRGP